MSVRKPEKLHQLNERQNDWDGIEYSELSFLQKVAKKTRGYVTAANAITIAGTVIVMNGLMDIASGNKGVGFAKIVGGRACDVADGEIADLTGTKGNVGRILDPSVDFVQLGFTLPVLVGSEMMPLGAAVAAGAPKVASAVASVTAFIRGQEADVSEEAKLGTTGLWTGIGAFMLRAVFDKHLPGAVDTGLEVLGWAGTVGGTAYQLPATKQYLQAGFGPTHHPKSDGA